MIDSFRRNTEGVIGAQLSSSSAHELQLLRQVTGPLGSPVGLNSHADAIHAIFTISSLSVFHNVNKCVQKL